MSDRIVLGWRERVSLPDWGIEDIIAKIDTGARTSSIHVEDLVDIGEGKIQFRVVTNRRKRQYALVECTEHKKTIVRSSSGHATERHVVRTRLTLAGVTREVEINLTARHTMTNRMLVGRTSLSESFLVDPSIEFLTSL
ncbi:MAG: RimK/LysX family protein [Fimbriimonadaceae bacterium]|nr:RimK/LysX family protein [Fimbriimonadaceae bacterium]